MGAGAGPGGARAARLLLALGFLSLFHAAFSAAQHRSYLRITAQEFTTLPIDIIWGSMGTNTRWKTVPNFSNRTQERPREPILLQGIISLFVVMYGVLCVAGEFKEIRSTVEMSSKTWETQRNIPSFYTFNHRGRALSPNYVPHSQKSDLENIE